MGLHEKKNSQGNFLTVKHGAICLESKEEKEGYELVEGEVNGHPYSKYIKKFESVDGVIVKIEQYDREGDGNRYRGVKIHLKDGGERYILDLPLGSRQYDYFTKIMDGIDYSKSVEFNAWLDMKAKSANKPTAFIAKQDGQIIQWTYTRENMGECPEAKQDEMGNWDFRDQRIWLFKRLRDVIIPKVDELHKFDEPEPEYDEPTHTGEPPAFPNGTPSDDEMPDEVKNQEDIPW